MAEEVGRHLRIQSLTYRARRYEGQLSIVDRCLTITEQDLDQLELFAGPK